jgi:hypothetical protein
MIGYSRSYSHFFYLNDPKAVLELIALMELGVVRGSIDH